MEIKVENRKKSNLLLVLAVIAVSLLVVWLIMTFDKNDDPRSQRSGIRVIKQTFAENSKYSLYDLIQIEKNYA
jgi:hypothetical protein